MGPQGAGPLQGRQWACPQVAGDRAEEEGLPQAGQGAGQSAESAQSFHTGTRACTHTYCIRKYLSCVHMPLEQYYHFICQP